MNKWFLVIIIFIAVSCNRKKVILTNNTLCFSKGVTNLKICIKKEIIDSTLLKHNCSSPIILIKDGSDDKKREFDLLHENEGYLWLYKGDTLKNIEFLLNDNITYVIQNYTEDNQEFYHFYFNLTSNSSLLKRVEKSPI